MRVSLFVHAVGPFSLFRCAVSIINGVYPPTGRVSVRSPSVECFRALAEATIPAVVLRTPRIDFRWFSVGDRYPDFSQASCTGFIRFRFTARHTEALRNFFNGDECLEDSSNTS